MSDRLFLSNDTVGGGVRKHEETFHFYLASESSALTGSATLLPRFIAPQAGRVVDFFIGVVRPALSASGFVSGTVDAGLRINSASILTTAPAIAMAANSAAAVRKSTNAGGGTSAVITVASSRFSAGDMISYDYNARSVGSAAAGAAGIGLYGGITVRYDAI
jgi:hypothetical protein